MRLLPVLTFLVIANQAYAQTVNLIANHIGVDGKALAQGQLCVLPVDHDNHPIIANLGEAGGVPITEGSCATIIGGVLSGGSKVPDTALTNPANVCLRLTITDSNQNGKLVYSSPCVQPSGSGLAATSQQAWCFVSGGVTTCSLDRYLQNQPLQTQAQPGSADPAKQPDDGRISGLSSDGASGIAAVGNVAADSNELSSGMWLNAAAYRGSDFSAKVSACLAAAEAAGGGTCDARGFPTRNAASQSITVGDGTHRIVLILPVGQVTFAPGKQLIYRSFSSIVGQGSGSFRVPASASSLQCTDTATSCVQSFNEPSKQLYSAHLSDFLIHNDGSHGSGSVGLEIGGPGNADVLSSRFMNLTIGGFDIGTQIGGAWGCTCYNSFDQVYSNGVSYGVSTINFSKYPGDVNSNTWTSGTAWGAVGLSDVGGGKNRWIGIDIESAKKHGIILGGYGNAVIYPYEEANGCDLLNGNDSMVIGPLSYGGGVWTPCPDSTSTNSFWFGPDATPNTIGVRKGILFGNTWMSSGPAAVMDLTRAGGSKASPLTLAYEAGTNFQNAYGYEGAAPLSVGGITSSGGFSGKGLITQIALSNPPAPSITAAGMTGSTTYQYRVVCHDWEGGVSLPSPAGSTMTGNAGLSSANYNLVEWDCGSGYKSADVLKYSDGAWQLLANDTGTLGNSHTGVKDIGQPVKAYTAPTRNTTGDAAISGNLAVGGSLTVAGAAPALTIAGGTISLATNPIASGACQTVTAASVNSAAAAGVRSTDTISFTPNRSVKAIRGYAPSASGGLTITAYPTAGFVNFDVCNGSGAAIVPGAVALNWRVVR